MLFYLFICFTHAAITKKSLKDLYSKYLTIDFDVESGSASGLSKEKNNMFYQLVYQKGLNEQTITKDHTFLIWLQGGPGCSSQSAFFELIGPFRITKSDTDFTIEKKDNSWNDFASILFIDQPFETGFSQGEILINSTLQASTYFVEFMVEFFKVHPEFLLAKTYLTGFSYTGHFAPQFSSSLLNSDIKFNYQGIIIGNGLQSMLHQTSSISSFLYVNGYISDEFKQVIKKEEYQIQSMILKQQDKLAGSAFIQYQDKLETFAKTDLTNILLKQEQKRSNDWISFMNKYKDQFGIQNSITEVCNQQVKQQMESDFSFDLTKIIEDLLNKGTVLFYDGQMDASINYAGTQNWLSSLKSEQIYQWKAAQKSIFKTNGKTVGNFKKTEKFTMVTIYNAGHAAVFDQPQILYQMMKHHLNNDQYWS
ncbi:unnamed protein product [Paramecium primaurelia]|uniref:Serine carboxypeptidase n=1 Tax=Paramecium primaurelia TaxID=5886 RepID=A0A8S1JQN7_PARPR|nr:unnamed protein product [Paramecium primaurelia]